MDETTRGNIASYLNLSRDELDTARLLIEQGKLRVATSRAYYAAFYAVTALLLSQDIIRVKHSAVEAAFNQFFVKPGHFPPEFSKTYANLRTARESGDYELAFAVDKQATQEYLNDARMLVEHIETYLKNAGIL